MANGKKERWYKTLKSEAIRRRTPLTLADAIAVVAAFVARYNDVRMHSALGYITPRALLEGRAAAIVGERREKLTAGRAARVAARRLEREVASAARPTCRTFEALARRTPTVALAAAGVYISSSRRDSKSR